MPTSISDLPKEMNKTILSFCDKPTLETLKKTNKMLRELSYEIDFDSVPNKIYYTHGKDLYKKPSWFDSPGGFHRNITERDVHQSLINYTTSWYDKDLKKHESHSIYLFENKIDLEFIINKTTSHRLDPAIFTVLCRRKLSELNFVDKTYYLPMTTDMRGFPHQESVKFKTCLVDTNSIIPLRAELARSGKDKSIDMSYEANQYLKFTR